MKKEWLNLQEETPKSVEDIRKILLKNREIEDMEAFLDAPHPKDISAEAVGIDPKALKKAADRIRKAQKDGEQVLVFGDYDADGICATAILWQTLHHMGIKAMPFIPHREKHGYGVSSEAIDDIVADNKPTLIITVDNGIVAHEPVIRLMEKEGIDVIITDHHQPETVDGKLTYPPAHAVVHTTQLCGATVGWMLARELDSEFAMQQLDLAGLATIADQVPLTGANRSFAKFGLENLRNTQRVGFQTLFQAASVKQDEISSSTVGYTIAPRINAMGRLKHGLDALRLLCTSSRPRASQLTSELMKTNVERQDLTSDLLIHAQEQAAPQKAEHMIVVADKRYPEGIIGLIAGRLAEQYHKPAIAISISGETAKASARSIPGVNIVEMLREVRDDLIEVGGHPMAAGFGIETKKIELVRDRLFELARDQIDETMLVPALNIDAQIPWELVSDELVEMTEEFEPFGQANPQPVFALDGVKILNIRTMGSDNQHIKLTVGQPNAKDANQSAKTVDVLGWRSGELASRLSEGDEISLAGTLEFNHWNGRRTIQMIMKDLKTK